MKSQMANSEYRFLSFITMELHDKILTQGSFLVIVVVVVEIIFNVPDVFVVA